MCCVWFRLPRSPVDPVRDGGFYVGDVGCSYLRNRG
jgi:hypothetical protein